MKFIKHVYKHAFFLALIVKKNTVFHHLKESSVINSKKFHSKKVTRIKEI